MSQGESVTALFNIKKHKGPGIVGDLVGLDNKIPQLMTIKIAAGVAAEG